MYKVLITSHAEKELKRLDRSTKNRILPVALALADDPRPPRMLESKSRGAIVAQHHQHTVYEGSIETLRNVLARRLTWAINEARSNRLARGTEQFELNVNDVRILSDPSTEQPPVVMRISRGPIHNASLVVRNVSPEMSAPISHVYLFGREDSAVTPYRYYQGGGRIKIIPVKAHASDTIDGLNQLYQLPAQIPSIPPQTFETFEFGISIKSEVEEGLRLRLHTSQRSYSYRFKIAPQDQSEA